MTGELARLLAVVVPAFNAAETLPAALASIAAQSVLPARVVVADDGSTDDTASIARSWSSIIPLEVVSLGTQHGPARARHTAIAAAGTELIALLDADDVWFPDHLAAMTAAYQRRPGLITADALRWIPDKGVGTTTFRQYWPLPEEGSQLVRLLRANFVFIGALFSIGAYEDAGGFRDGFSGCEDWDLWIRMSRRGVVISGPSHPTVLYRLARTSLSADDRALDQNIALLNRVVIEARAGIERRTAVRTLSRLRSRRHLVHAYAHARHGRAMAARREAVRALLGPRAVRARASFLLASPRLGTRLRDRRKWETERWLER